MYGCFAAAWDFNFPVINNINHRKIEKIRPLGACTYSTLNKRD